MHLLLMRHAKSSWDQPGLDDHDRPLNERGLRAAPRMARHLQDQGLQPDRIVCSTAKRAEQTASLVGKTCGVIPIQNENLYLADPETWREILRTQPRSKCLLIVGHNFGIEEFIEELAGDYHRMPTAAVAHFHVTQAEGPLSKENLDFVTVWRPKELPGH